MKRKKSKNYNGTVEAVASALIIKDDKILLIKSHKWGDSYLIPGGHIEHEEKIFDAAKREGEEETGLKLKPLYLVNFGELINSPSFNRKAHLIYFHVVCEALNDKVKLDNKELKDFIWINPKEALKLPNLLAYKTIKNYIDKVKIKIGSEKF